MGHKYYQLASLWNQSTLILRHHFLKIVQVCVMMSYHCGISYFSGILLLQPDLFTALMLMPQR
jgi:hypothetical protein